MKVPSSIAVADYSHGYAAWEIAIRLKAEEFSMPLFSFSGQRPTTLGVHNGRLMSCPSSPNCVCSYDSDSTHSIEPFAYSDTGDEAIARIKEIVLATERTRIIESSNDYLYAEFTSSLMGYVDDVEFYADPTAKVIHVRSASRLGKSDLGANRQRIESIREQFGR